MPEYIVYYQPKKNATGKPKTEPILAPCVGDAWQQAQSIVPRGNKIIDVVRAGEMPSRPYTVLQE